ncbi:MAG: class I SAM-dependent methyltransferase [Bacillota bacterium]|nr:class I SAM-dependent methyltransferase [Bacillota bacterium]
MNLVYRQAQLYKFLNMCNNTPLEKTVLDCGAGGKYPPLGMFWEHGYKTLGIELDDIQRMEAVEFENNYGMGLNILKGDMRNLPFEDNSVSFAYSYNSIFHMKKEDIMKSISEIRRVMKPGGLCFINLLTTADFRYGTGELIGDGEYYQDEGDTTVIHSYFSEDEGDSYFKDMDVIYKEIRILERLVEGHWIKQGYVDYIARKKTA